MDHGSSSSSSQSKQRSKTSKQIRQLNDSLFELYKPQGPPSMQILFFHGFQRGDYTDAHLSTWKSGDDSCLWPQTWLAEEYPNAHILSVSYNSGLKKTEKCGDMDMFILGENLMANLLQANIGQAPRCPVVLVGHSFGGLIMKQVCYQAKKKARRSQNANFLENLKGLFFYATPHHGIPPHNGVPFEKLVAEFVTQKAMLEYVKTLSKPTSRLNDDFEDIRRDNNTWLIAGVGECLPIKLGPFGDCIVVPEASARYGDFLMVTDANHLSICRPVKKISTSFTALTTLLCSISSSSQIEESTENFQHLPKQIVGIEHVLQEVKRKLQKATRLGLAGMGGLGKSTLARALFNDLIREGTYEYTCFIKDVKNIDDLVKDGVLKHMHHWGKHIGSNGDRLAFLRGKRLLLILDDVASEEKHLAIVLANYYHVHEDSRVIATSRDSELLRCLDEVYPVPFLDSKSSKRLFLGYAFREEVPNPPSLERNVNEIVKKCGGLPLTLEVIGKYLYQKPATIWEQTLIALDRADKVSQFDEKLWAKLKLSYDGLEEVEQEMFVHAATIFYKHELTKEMMEYWRIIAKELPDMRWQHLRDLSLVWEVEDVPSFGIGSRVGMHEQLLSLGRKIALEKGHMVWEITKAWEILSQESYNKDVIKDVVALKLGDPCYSGFEDPMLEDLDRFYSNDHRTKKKRVILGTILCKMEKLQYLRMRDIDIDIGRIDGATFPSTLVFLDLWDVKFCDRRGPRECNGHRTQLGTFGNLAALQYFKFRGGDGLPELLYSFGDLPRLTRMIIHYSSIIPDLPFANMQALEVLELKLERKLSALPDSIGCLSRLKRLEIMDCWGLAKVPETFGNLQALEYLRIERFDLAALPDSFGCLSRLKTLILKDLLLPWLPKTLGDLQALEFLEIVRCRALSALPDSFGCLSRLKRLKRLILKDLPLRGLPETFGDLQALESLEIGNCGALSALPDSFGNLQALESLVIEDCGALSAVPDSFGNLQALESLDIVECNALSALPDSFGRLQRLKKLRIISGSCLRYLPRTFLQLPALVQIDLWWTHLKRIPNLEKLTSLKTLILSFLCTARFPKLPKCLVGVITPGNYTTYYPDFHSFRVEKGTLLYEGHIQQHEYSSWRK